MTHVLLSLDTADVPLDRHVLDLIEPLAARVHHRWFERRMQDGWRPGLRRDDGRRVHPCLVPYAELPEREKEYDRIMVRETLKTLMALGFELIPQDRDVDLSSAESRDASSQS